MRVKILKTLIIELKLNLFSFLIVYVLDWDNGTHVRFKLLRKLNMVPKLCYDLPALLLFAASTVGMALLSYVGA